MEITNVITVANDNSSVTSVKSFTDVVKAQEYFAKVIRESNANMSDDEFDEHLGYGYCDINHAMNTVYIHHSDLQIPKQIVEVRGGVADTNSNLVEIIDYDNEEELVHKIADAVKSNGEPFTLTDKIATNYGYIVAIDTNDVEMEGGTVEPFERFDTDDLQDIWDEIQILLDEQSKSIDRCKSENWD